MIHQPIESLLIAYVCLVLIYFGGGAFTKYEEDEKSFLQAFFDKISPFRYTAELMIEIILSKHDYKDWVLEQMDY